MQTDSLIDEGVYFIDDHRYASSTTRSLSASYNNTIFKKIYYWAQQVFASIIRHEKIEQSIIIVCTLPHRV